MALYDEDGNLVEDVASKEDIEKLKEEYEQKLKEKEELIAKKDDKENNFSGLRKKTEAEKKEIMDKASEEIKILNEKIEALQTQTSAPVTQKREKIIKEYARTPEQEKTFREELDKIESAYGKPQTDAEVQERATIAVAAINARTGEQGNPLTSFAPAGDRTDYYGQKKKVNYADTDEGKAFAASIGLDLEEPKKA